MASFDPYHRWLGIHPKNQPATYYALLGIEEYENDPDVIVDAADRQISHVRRYELGEYSHLSQRLLNELARARTTLLDIERKAAYDLELSNTRPPLALPAVSPPVAAASPPRPSLTPCPSMPVPNAANDVPLNAQGEELHQAISSCAPRMHTAPAIKRHRSRFRYLNTAMHIVAPLAGLFVGYCVLCLLGPQYDFLEIRHSPSGYDASLSHDRLDLAAAQGAAPKSTSNDVKPAPLDEAAAVHAPEPHGRSPEEPDAAEVMAPVPEPALPPVRQVERTVEWLPARSSDIYGTPFREYRKEGFILVGIEVTTGRYGAGYKYRAVASIRAIFRTPDGSLTKSSRHGHSGSHGKEFIARDGYAIGGIKIAKASNNRIVGVRIQFMRMTDETLVPGDSYWSESYLQDATDLIFKSDGRPIVGIGGKYAKQELRDLEFASVSVVYK